jgi:hypothetical protein
VLVVRRFAFFEFNLKAAALILAPLGVALISLTRVQNGANVVFCSPDSPILSHQIIQDDPRLRRARRRPEITPGDYIACRWGWRRVIQRPVNRNIFYIIGVIVVIVIVLKLLHVF